MPTPRKRPLPPLPKSVDNKSIGDRIVKLRKLQGKTQFKLASIIGLSRSHLGNYENGLIHLNDEMVIRFAHALKVSTDKLLGFEVDNKTVENPPNVRLIKRMQEIEKLPPSDQKVIIRTLDTFLKGSNSK